MFCISDPTPEPLKPRRKTDPVRQDPCTAVSYEQVPLYKPLNLERKTDPGVRDGRPVQAEQEEAFHGPRLGRLRVPGTTPSSRFFFITLKPRVEWYTKSVSLKYEPASEPLHISVK